MMPPKSIKKILLKMLYVFTALVESLEYNHEVKCLLITGWDVIDTITASQ